MKFIFEKLLTGDDNLEFDYEGGKLTGKIVRIDLENKSLIVKLDNPLKQKVTRYVPCMFSMDEDGTCPEEVEEYKTELKVYVN